MERAESAPQSRTEEIGPVETYEFRRRFQVVRVGGDFTLASGDEADDVVVVSGHTRIDGTVHGSVSVVFGDAEIGDTASIDGSVVIVGGTVTVSPGARVRDAFIAAGAAVKETTGFKPGDAHIVIDPRALGIDTMTLTAWITHGILMGRPLPPTVQRAWIVVLLCLFTYLILLLVAERPVRRCAQTLNAGR